MNSDSRSVGVAEVGDGERGVHQKDGGDRSQVKMVVLTKMTMVMVVMMVVVVVMMMVMVNRRAEMKSTKHCSIPQLCHKQ